MIKVNIDLLQKLSPKTMVKCLSANLNVQWNLRTLCNKLMSEDENSSQGENGSAGSPKEELPQPPDNCCMTGCANCVWIKYVDEMNALHNNGGTAALEAIERVSDPTLKAFLKMELKSR